MNTSPHRLANPTVLLIPGYWLGAWAWDEVLEHLTAAGVRARAITLPGLDPHDPQRTTCTLTDQATAIREAVAQEDGGVVVVAHSGASGPVSMVLDQLPAQVRRVVWIDSGPAAPGTAFAADLPATVSELPLPARDELGTQASLEGLSAEQLERFQARAVPEPAGVARQPVSLSNPARLRVPTTFVCSSLPSEQVKQLAAAGHPMFAEVAGLTDADFIDLPTGHWPMWSRPRDLADAIQAAAHRSS